MDGGFGYRVLLPVLMRSGSLSPWAGQITPSVIKNYSRRAEVPVKWSYTS